MTARRGIARMIDHTLLGPEAAGAGRPGASATTAVLQGLGD